MKLKYNDGFTIVELMVVIAMVVVLIAIATPQINQTFDNFQFSNGMRMALNTMNRAKGEAMNSGLFTSVVFTTAANGRVTYTAFVDDGTGAGGVARNGVRDGTERLISSDNLPRGVSINTNAANTTFQKALIGGVQSPYTQFSPLGFPIGSNPINGAVLTNYSGNIEFNATIGQTLVVQTIQLGLGGGLRIVRT